MLVVAASQPAWSYTLNFTGTVNSTDGIFTAAGITPGDAISGSLTYNPLSSVASVTLPGPDSVSVFPQASGSFTFHVSHPGVFDYTQSRNGAGQVESNGSPLGDRVGLYLGDGNLNDLQLSYRTDGTAPALTSLAALPTDSDGILAMLTGHAVSAVGFYRSGDFGSVSFNLAFTPAVATTPIPAALPLFASTLGGLGVLAWRRRGASGRTAVPRPARR
ncbi:MAG TPA: hypothetical protein VEC60_01070 [Reyranella sp.]|nr:hypothetical protein [Reyranella sp.]